MGSNNKKKLIVSSVIAVAFLIMLTVGATYAYFSASSDSNAITNIAGRTPKLSNIVLSQLIDNLHIRLQPSDLNKNSTVKTYYATSDETKNYEITEEAGTNIIASVSVLQDATNTYECSANITISLISEKENSLSEVINKNDLKLKLTGNSLEEEYDLSNLKNEEEANKKVYVTNFDVSKINKNEIKLQVLLNNDPNKAQDYLVNKELNISVEVSDLKCILKDTTAPTIEEFTVTGVTDNTELTNDKLYTHTNEVSYKLTFTDEDVESYCITENDSCNEEEWKSVGDSKTITNTLTFSDDNEGLKTINAFLKDKKGNISITKTKTITLDSSNPTAEVTKNTQDTSSITVTVSGTDTTPSSSIIERQCRKSGGSWVTASNSNGSCTINNLNDGTEYTIEGRVRDASGRWSQEPYPSVSVTTEKEKITGSYLYSNPPKGMTVTDCQGMKRFVGTKDDVNNYVCFGYTNISQCSSGVKDNEYIYRIIGINSNGEIKLIKNKPLVSYYQWYRSYDNSVPWDQTDLYKSVNGSDFLTKLSSNWQAKIMNHSWPNGNITNGDTVASSLCATEKGLTSISAKVGLMTLSDYYYADGGASSNCMSKGRDTSACIESWMGIYNNECTRPDSDTVFEKTMVRKDASTAYVVRWDSYNNDYGMCSEVYSLGGIARPVFYLPPATVVSSGEGTPSSPFIIS